MQMKVSIISTESVLYEGHATLLVLPGKDGELGVMPMHENVLVQLNSGQIKVFIHGLEPDYTFSIVSGYASVSGGICSVIVSV